MGVHHTQRDSMYQIPWGHCNVTAAISDEARQKLYKPPGTDTPNKLTESRPTFSLAVIYFTKKMINFIVFVYVAIVRLTEAYYECKKSAQDSFISAVGLSSATVLSVKVLVVLFVTVVMSRDRNLLKKNGLYKTYGIDERLEVSFPFPGLFRPISNILAHSQMYICI